MVRRLAPKLRPWGWFSKGRAQDCPRLASGFHTHIDDIGNTLAKGASWCSSHTCVMLPAAESCAHSRFDPWHKGTVHGAANLGRKADRLPLLLGKIDCPIVVWSLRANRYFSVPSKDLRSLQAPGATASRRFPGDAGSHSRYICHCSKRSTACLCSQEKI